MKLQFDLAIIFGIDIIFKFSSVYFKLKVDFTHAIQIHKLKNMALWLLKAFFQLFDNVLILIQEAEFLIKVLVDFWSDKVVFLLSWE